MSEAQKLNSNNTKIADYMIKIKALEQEVEKQRKNNKKI